MHLGEKIKSLRKEKNWTQPQLAEAIGIEQSYLSKLENGKSVPSADIFELLLSTFEIDVDELLLDIDQSVIYRQLRQIPEVSNHLADKQTTNLKARKRWLLVSSFCLINGLLLLIASQFGLLFPEIQYQYVSPGIVQEGESKEIYSNFLLGYAGYDNKEMKKRTLEFNKRMDEVYLLSSSYQGEIFNVPVTGGSRTYRLKGSHGLAREENSYLAFAGLFLLLVGIFGFILEKKMTQN